MLWLQCVANCLELWRLFFNQWEVLRSLENTDKLVLILLTGYDAIALPRSAHTRFCPGGGHLQLFQHNVVTEGTNGKGIENVTIHLAMKV